MNIRYTSISCILPSLEKYLMDVEGCGKESLETKKSALLGQQYPRKRDSTCESHSFDH